LVFKRRLAFAVDVLLLIAALLAVVLLIRKHIARAETPPAFYTIGRPIPADFDGETARWQSAKLHILILISEHCDVCRKSVPFYRTVLDRTRGKTQIKVTMVGVEGINAARRAAEKFQLPMDQAAFSGIRFANDTRLSVPAVLVLDSTGTVQVGWSGKLDRRQQASFWQWLETSGFGGES